MFRLNPTILVAIMLGIGIETSFVRSIILNGVVVLISGVYLLTQRPNFKLIGLMILISLPLAFGTWWSFIAFGTGDTHHLALVYATRLYAYLFLGAAVTLTVSVKDLLMSLNQHAKISNTFTYGLLAAFNLVPRVRRQVQIIRYAGALRGVTYHLWQPQIYFKAILSALHWSDDLAIAMTSHGFSEGFPRTQTVTDHLSKWEWLLPIIFVLLYLLVAIIFKPW
ncbi:energy-coupling factor transporter transmembrane component T family protein [Weissella sagaensis]|uniref:Energy-coupling factor transporter transmembrane component T family protein n=1 Tax=Weissella sagaensis TaxID=2559928 RepID=A0ABW1RRZ1_9LACO|nr:energy-coupling factor transporter transmembrane component T [Weissella sagaensis]